LKRIIALLIALSMFLSLFVSCGKGEETTTTKTTQTITKENITVEDVSDEKEVSESESETDESTEKITEEKSTENVTEEDFSEEYIEIDDEEWLDEEIDYFAMYQPPETKTKTYNTLKKELDNVIKKRGYKGREKQVVINTFNALYNSYSTWKVGYRDLPSTEDYIRTTYIDILKHVVVKCYVSDTEEYKEYCKKEPYVCDCSHMEPLDNGECKVVMILLKDEEKTPELTSVETEEFFHEVTHCRAHLYVYETSDVEYESINLILEGAATFHMKFAKKMNYEHGGSWCVAKKDESVCLEYRKDNCVGYLTYLNAYEKLVYLLGYDTIFEYENGDLSYGDIRNKLAKKYGENIGGKFLTTMSDWHNESDGNYANDKAFSLAIEFENLFFECLKKDIKNLKTKKEAEEFIRIYDHYKKRNMPVTVNADGEELPTVFDVASVDKELKIKVKEFGIKYIPA